jgi:saccharopine dehydrogenase (NADP+, L-glutamate forming)
MNYVLVLGAGRSSASLIQYLLDQSAALQLKITVGDFAESAARERIGSHPHGRAISFDITNATASEKEIAMADIVISLLPAHLHPLVAKICLEKRKHLLTASYISDEMKGFHEEAQKNGLLFLNECGLDPGIDHMSAMQVMDRVRAAGGTIDSFESFTGGLIAPETDPTNPWRYKFTWNARNVVMAGQGTAKYLQNGEYKYISYPQLFKRITPVEVPGFGAYDGYANRDSLKYIEAYGLQGVKTMLRGTLRNKGFCEAWDAFVQLGCCDDTYLMESVGQMTHRGFLNSFLAFDRSLTVEQKIARQLNWAIDSPAIQKLRWAGLFDEEKIGLEKGTPAQILEHILNKKWKLAPEDVDMIVMWHRFGFRHNGEQREIQASLVVRGSDAIHTAMAKTVGLPLGIAATCLVKKRISITGVMAPVIPAIYAPIMEELDGMGIKLEEREMAVTS